LVPSEVEPLDGAPAAAIDRVEEDWEVVVKSGNVEAAGPQITTTMCPGATSDHPTINFNLNYRDHPSFHAGGLQVLAWDGGDLLDSASSHSESLQTDGETIAWTQRLSLANGIAEFRVVSGLSTTWGEFGGDDLAIMFEVALEDLTSYTPDISIGKSGIGWQSDHVESMKLVRVRYYCGETLVGTDETTRVIHLD